MLCTLIKVKWNIVNLWIYNASTSSFSKQFNRTPPLSFQNKASSMIQYFNDFILKNLALVLNKLGGDCKFSKTNMISTYQGESIKGSLICVVTISS